MTTARYPLIRVEPSGFVIMCSWCVSPAKLAAYARTYRISHGICSRCETALHAEMDAREARQRVAPPATDRYTDRKQAPMKLLTLALVALVAAGCNGVLPTEPSKNPGGLDMTPYTPTPTPPTVSIPGPHFALEIHGPATATTAAPWSGSVFVGANINIPQPELPLRVVTTCGATTQTHGLGAGTSPIRCELPLGTHQIVAVAEMADGRRYPSGFAVTVSRPVLPPLEVFFDLYDSVAGVGNTVTFSVRTVEGASYRWDFGDGSTATTMLPSTKHLYSGGRSQERRVTATAVDRDGVTLTTGSVVGRW